MKLFSHVFFEMLSPLFTTTMHFYDRHVTSCHGAKICLSRSLIELTVRYTLYLVSSEIERNFQLLKMTRPEFEKKDGMRIGSSDSGQAKEANKVQKMPEIVTSFLCNDDDLSIAI